MRAFTKSCIIAGLGVLVACSGSKKPRADTANLPDTLFVASQGDQTLVSYNVSTGEERAGSVTAVTSPTDAQAVGNGLILVNLTAASQVLAVDGRTMLERARLASSGATAVRPVHSFVTPAIDGKQYWVSANDGTAGDASTDSAAFIDVVPTSATFLQRVGEVPLGIGHHKAAFSATHSRAVITNIADCDNVLSVYDYSDIQNIQKLATASALSLGWDSSSFGRTCDQTFVNGVPPSPHGCAMSKVSGKAYCNLTGSGEIVVVDINATPPTFTKRATTGSGGGYTAASHDGAYIYSLLASPREGSTTSPGAVCQVGKLVVLDAHTDAVVREMPLSYGGPGCTTAIAGTDEASAEPGHIIASADGRTLFIRMDGGFGIDTARVRKELVVDISDPTNPEQKESITVGASTDHHGDTLTGDGKYLFIANNIDDTVTQIDVASLTVVRNIKTHPGPETVATFGSIEGPGHQAGPVE